MVAPSRALALLLAQSSAALQLLPLAPPPSRLVPSAARPAVLPGDVARHATSVIACADHDGDDDDDDFDIQVSLADTDTGLSIECNLMETMDMDGSLFAAMTYAATRPARAHPPPDDARVCRIQAEGLSSDDRDVGDGHDGRDRR